MNKNERDSFQDRENVILDQNRIGWIGRYNNFYDLENWFFWRIGIFGGFEESVALREIVGICDLVALGELVTLGENW